MCTHLKKSVPMLPPRSRCTQQIVSLLRLIESENQAGAVVVTTGVALTWEKILAANGFADHVKVIGGGRISHGLVVDAAVKGALATGLRERHKIFVTALGDSVLDLPMLKAANHAVVAVGNEVSRSKLMEATLDTWIEAGLRARQAILASDNTHRLDTEILPLVDLTAPSFAQIIFPHRHETTTLDFAHLTDSKAAKVLMTPMRNANNSGPSLREAHRKTGWYIAHSALLEYLGIEQYPILHVQGKQTDGYRLAGEKSTLIVALMRGGEPLALGNY